MLRTRDLELTATVLRLPDGRELAFAEYGEPAGVPVFAFHGTPGSRLQLVPAGTAASDAGVRLIVPDRPGYGFSSLRPDRRLTDWPGDVAAIADHLDVENFAVLGVSGGGPHAIACAAGLPARVTAVGLVSSPSPDAFATAGPRELRWLRRITGAQQLVRLFVALLLLAVRRFPFAVLRAARRAMPEADRRVVDDPEFRSYFVDTAGRSSATTARATAQDIALFTRDWGIDRDAVVAPVTIWHGTADRLVEPWNADVLGAMLPGARIERIDGEGHLLFAVWPDRILRDLVGTVRIGPTVRRPA